MNHRHPESWITPTRLVTRLLGWFPRPAGSRTCFGASTVDAQEEPANSDPRAGREVRLRRASEQASRPCGSKWGIGPADYRKGFWMVRAHSIAPPYNHVCASWPPLD